MKQLSAILDSKTFEPKIFTEIFEEIRREILTAVSDKLDGAKLEKLLKNLCKKTRDEQIKFLQKDIVFNFDALRIILEIISRDLFAAEKLKISNDVAEKIKTQEF
ncbi:hypothetical protein KKF38_04305 [Patescibacteria group bacterium]|nr:hypothetical protein [Patescibacteria group bacterium]